MTPEHHEERLCAWAEKTGRPVLSLDYGKAPECECNLFHLFYVNYHPHPGSPIGICFEYAGRRGGCVIRARQPSCYDCLNNLCLCRGP